jgi:hypothetical protein
MLIHHKTWLISVKDTDMCFQTTVLIEFAYGKRERFKVSAHLNELTKFVGPGALPPRHGMIRSRQHAKSDTNIFTGTSGHTTLTVSVLFKMVDYGGTIPLTLLSPRRVPYGLQSLNQTLFFL